MERLVQVFDERAVSDHPLFVELRSRPAVDHAALWVLLANLQVGISRDFVVWLARTIEKVEDRRIASLVAKQLNDELGNGEFGEIHSVLLQRFVTALERWRPSEADARTLEPGRRLQRAEDELFGADAFVMVGALLSGEIFANKMDHCLGDELRRQNQVDLEALRWLMLHEVLEEDHAGDSSELAKLVPSTPQVTEAVVQGAHTQWNILWRFLDDVHQELHRLQS